MIYYYNPFGIDVHITYMKLYHLSGTENNLYNCKYTQLLVDLIS